MKGKVVVGLILGTALWVTAQVAPPPDPEPAEWVSCFCNSERRLCWCTDTEGVTDESTLVPADIDDPTVTYPWKWCYWVVNEVPICNDGIQL